MTRFLLLFSALLVLLNAAVFLWPDKTNHGPHIYTVKDDVNPHFVRLNREIEERFYSQPTIEVTERLDPIANERADPLDSSIVAARSSDANQGCFRIGPFMHQANYELAQAVLFNADVDYRKSKRASSASNVFRIYLGPFQTKAETDDARLDLKRKNVLDHFVRKRGDGTQIISLGIYSTPETASTALRLFNDKLGDVKQRDENVVLPDSYWLHFNADQDQSMIRQLSILDWGEPSAKMGLFGCGA